MIVHLHSADFARLSDEELDGWTGADADGVTVVPLDRVKVTLTAYLALKKTEAKALASLDNGGTLADVYGAPEVIEV